MKGEKNLMKKKVIASLLSASLFLQPATTLLPETVYATPTISYANIQELESEIQKLDNEIIEMIAEIEKLNKSIVNKNKEIEKLQEEIVEKEKRFNNIMEIYMNRLQVLQQQDSFELNIINLLFSSEGIVDFFNRIYAVSIILENDQKILDTVQKSKNELKDSRKKLKSELEKLEENKIKMSEKKEELEKKKDEATKEIERISREQQIMFKHKHHQFPSSAPSVSSPKAQEILDEAFKHLGTPYVWGGTTPNGFDCSGFTQYVYKKSGISLPRTSKEQQQVGTPIPLSELQPGDLVFMGNPAYHVGIYIGNGKYIHSPQTNDVVKVSNLYNISSASRVF